ncbi:MAG TPA: molecular chaperone DnaK, partial [Gemmata sp.]|nr:molecular chaperone DnaK [Gemmata sp.]
LRHSEKALGQAGHALNTEQREAIDAATAGLKTATSGTDLAALQRSLDVFAAATNPLAQLQMNEVLRKTLGGEDPNSLDPNRL